MEGSGAFEGSSRGLINGSNGPGRSNGGHSWAPGGSLPLPLQHHQSSPMAPSPSTAVSCAGPRQLAQQQQDSLMRDSSSSGRENGSGGSWLTHEMKNAVRSQIDRIVMSYNSWCDQILLSGWVGIRYRMNSLEKQVAVMIITQSISITARQISGKTKPEEKYSENNGTAYLCPSYFWGAAYFWIVLKN